MSSSEAVTRAWGCLLVEAPPGVEISLLDGALAAIAQGTLSLRRDLPEGIYTVRWHAAGRTEQRVVRLKGSDQPLLLRYHDRNVAHPAPIIGAARDELEAHQFEAFQEVLARRTAGALAGGEQAEILLLVRADDARTRADPGRMLRLAPQPEPDKRAGPDAEIAPRRSGDPQAGWSVLRFSVAPGAYMLRYEAADRSIVAQAIQALAGRRTLVFLRYGREAVREGAGDAAQFKSRRGIDPGATIIVSARRGEFESLDEPYRLAEILLHALGRRAGRLPSGLVPVLLLAGTDPFLRLYAIAVLMTRPPLSSEGGFKAADGPVPEPAAPPENVTDATVLLRALLADLPDAPDRGWSDLICARWRLALAGEAPEPTSLPARLTGPPMLETGWRWASAWSIEHGEALAGLSNSALAAGAGQVRGNPWLAWRVAGAVMQPAATENVERLRAQTTELAAKLETLIEAGSRPMETRAPKQVPQPRIDLARLSPGSRSLSQTMMQLGGAAAWSHPDGVLLRRLASSAGAPAERLVARLDAAMAEMAGPAELSDTAPDPWSLDPLKGEFGGRAEVDGVRLVLERFGPSNHPDRLALTVVVAADRPGAEIGPAVTFHLHPTFNPSAETVRATAGRAEFTCYAMGGFTLGAETAAGTRLELDLALDERLPEWFRER